MAHSTSVLGTHPTRVSSLAGSIDLKHRFCLSLRSLPRSTAVPHATLQAGPFRLRQALRQPSLMQRRRRGVHVAATAEVASPAPSDAARPGALRAAAQGPRRSPRGATRAAEGNGGGEVCTARAGPWASSSSRVVTLRGGEAAGRGAEEEPRSPAEGPLRAGGRPPEMRRRRALVQAAAAAGWRGLGGTCRCGAATASGAGLVAAHLGGPLGRALALPEPAALQGPREWLFAQSMEQGMAKYERVLRPTKARLFAQLPEDCKQVLEIGIGTGPNLKYYASRAERVVGVEPNASMSSYTRSKAEQYGVALDMVQARAEDLQVPTGSVDAVVATLVLCSVEDPQQALQQVMRVLRPGGRFLFIEHVAAAPGSPLAAQQQFFDPLQQLLAEGCHVTRDTAAAIRSFTDQGQAGAGGGTPSATAPNAAYLSSLSVQQFEVPGTWLISPHIAGVGVRSDLPYDSI